MLEFKKIELTDKTIIDKSLVNNTYRACDFCFTNMYTWTPKFRTEFAVVENTLFLKSCEECQQTYYMMPIGGSIPVADAIKLIMDDAEANNIPFLMKGVSRKMWDILEKELPNKFTYFHDRNNDEYIYLSEKLISLSGKKLQSKRNHINRFKADNPNWEYISIRKQRDLELCEKMLHDWDKEKEELDKTLKYDYIATKLMLDNFDFLNLKGGMILIDGELVAFSIGEPLTKDTFVVHVEKAFGHINGAYAIINQQFVLNEASKFTYINREEDMGSEALRKAKMSYRPEILLEEGIVQLKEG